MKLTRIRVEQFKQFRKPIEIRDLDDGINLFTGPNEAGKSTIVAAIRAAFFERHRSSSVDDLRPWGDSSASPTVEIEFIIGNKSYQLTKNFLSKKRCELQVETQHLDGVSAEDHLSDLLGFQYAGKGISAAQHWGIPGLLWIQQGSAQDVKDSVTHATEHLQTALNQSLGEMTSSGGDEVLATVEAARNELLTTAIGAPRGTYADAEKQQSKLEWTLKNIDAEIDAYRQKVDRLASLRREHLVDEAEQPWVAFRNQEQDARVKLNAIERVQESLIEDRKRADQLDTQVKLLRTQVEAFTEQKQTAEIRKGAVESATQVLSAATSLVEQWRAESAEASKNYESARVILRLARQEETRGNRTRQVADLKQKADYAAAALAKAEQKQASLLELQKQAAASEINADDLNLLRDQSRQLRELYIQREASATRLRFTLFDGHSIQVGEKSISGIGELLLLEPTTLQLAELGKLEISPGGADLAELGRREKAIADDHVALLQRLGLTSLEAAEIRYQIHSQRLAEVKTASATLKVVAPKGIEALRSEAASQETRAQDIELTLKQLPVAPENVDEPPSVSQAEAVEEAMRLLFDQINTSLSEAQVSASTAQTELEAAKRELAGAQALLDAPDRATTMVEANQALVDARAEQATLVATVEAKIREVAQACPDILKQDVERFRKSADQHEKHFAERGANLLRIEIELEVVGAQGLEERRAELDRSLMQVQRRVDELRKRATALNHLLGLLREKRSALTRKLQAPLQKHLNRYLQLLFPQAHLEIDENLTPGPLTRTKSNGPESGDFEALSFGAREQLGVISRLAYADLLQEAGRPTLIILDDALVHSDEERLAQMKRVLFDAATRHQILLFTCHSLNWRDLGVSPRPLAGIR